MRLGKEKTGFLRLFILALTILIVQNNFAQAPAGYYDSATGSGYTLKTQLYNIIKGHTVRSYDQLWSDFQTTDRKANGYVWDMYSDKPGTTPAYEYTFYSDQCGNYSGEGSCYNREHSFPKSWFNDATPMYSELFHLYPTDGYVNGKRSNYPFGEVGSASWTSTNGSKLGTSNYPGYTGVVFEPIDEYKGDFARTYFYMATRYENIIAGWENNDSNGDAVLNGTADQVYEDWYLNMIIEWHNNDPVSPKEIDRNNAVYSIQNNRNPFIDHPEYVAKIWGGEISNNPPSISEIILNPASPKSTDPVNVSATITDSDGTVTSAILRWGLVSGNLSNTINLTNSSGSTYSTVSVIPVQVDGTTVYYKIEATDDSSDVAMTSENSYTVNDETNTSIFFEDFETSIADAPININNWMRYEEAGTETWEGRLYNSNKYAQFSAYNSGESSNIGWLITPAIDLTGNATAKFSFISKDGYNNGEVLTVLISTSYTGIGNPALSSWYNLNPIIASGTTTGYATNFTESGEIDISSYCGNNIFIAFRYVGGDPSKTTTMQIDNVSISGTAAVNIPPIINSIEINPELPLVGQDVIVSAIITDSDGTVSSAVINFGTTSGNYTNVVSMTKLGDQFSGIIPSQLAATTIYFVIEATDDDSEESMSVEQSFLVTEPQNNPPVLSNIQYTPTNPDQNQSVTVNVHAIDSDGTISYCGIKWGIVSGVYSNIVNMTFESESYTGIISGQTGGTIVYFKIVAVDEDNDSSMTDEYNYAVNTPGNVNPVIADLVFAPEAPTSTESVSVSATITDDDGQIVSAKIKWGTSSGVFPNQISMNSSNSLFSGVIPSQTNLTHIYFIVEATDNSGGSTTSLEKNYVIQDQLNQAPIISNVQITPNPPTDQDSVLIAASITDSEGTISTAILNWKRNAETTIYEEEMVYDGTQFTSYIPAQEAGKTIYFMIVATDNDNAETSYMDGMYTITSSSGFENTDLSEAIHIYPNPTRDVINILVNETVSNCKIAISNMLGVKILEEEAPVLNGTYLVNLSGKPKGFYYLTITTNEVIINKKIVLF